MQAGTPAVPGEVVPDGVVGVEKNVML